MTIRLVLLTSFQWRTVTENETSKHISRQMNIYVLPKLFAWAANLKLTGWPCIQFNMPPQLPPPIGLSAGELWLTETLGKLVSTSTFKKCMKNIGWYLHYIHRYRRLPLKYGLKWWQFSILFLLMLFLHKKDPKYSSFMFARSTLAASIYLFFILFFPARAFVNPLLPRFNFFLFLPWGISQL